MPQFFEYLTNPLERIFVPVKIPSTQDLNDDAEDNLRPQRYRKHLDFKYKETDNYTKEIDDTYADNVDSKNTNTERDNILTDLNKNGSTKTNFFKLELLQGPRWDLATSQFSIAGFNEQEFSLLLELTKRLTTGIYCRAASFPSISIEITDNVIYGKHNKRATQRTFDQVSVTFMDDKQGIIRRFIYWWMYLIDQNTLNSIRLFPNEYQGRMAISSLDLVGNVTTRGIFTGVFPQQLGDLSFDSTNDNDLATFPVSFDFNDWQYEHTPVVMPKKAMGTSSVSSLIRSA